jgi:hypothetical protein
MFANPQTHGELRRALVAALCGSASYSQSILLRDYIPGITDFTDEEKTAMRDACEKNSQVSNAYKVSDTIHKAFGDPTNLGAKSVEVDDMPF